MFPTPVYMKKYLLPTLLKKTGLLCIPGFFTLFLSVINLQTTTAQIPVTVTGTAVTSPALAASYTTLADALTAVNAVTSFSTPGTIILTCTAGSSETAPPTGFVLGSATLNPLLSATNAITINKSGGTVTINAGTGTATPASAAPDGMFSIRGADHVTIDGLTFTDGNGTNPATMEFGIGLFKAGAGDGCNNNTIQNCTINMQRINNASSTAPMIEGAVGILVINSTATTATTAITPTNGGTLATNGTNSGNKFYTNTINSGNYGIGLSGYAASSGVGPNPTATTFLGDLGNDVGGASAGTGNSILNYGGAATATNPSAGIRANNQWSVNISYNTVNNNNGSGVNHVTTLRGIYAQAGTSANATINNNTLSVQSGATTSSCNVIDNGIGSTAAANTITINNNTINVGYPTATSGVLIGINNSSSAATLNINGNTIGQIGSVALAGTGTHLIIETGSPGTVTVNSNMITNITRNGASGSWRIIKTTSPSNLTVNGNTIDGMSWSAAASTGSIDGFYGLSSAVNVTVTNNIIRNFSTPTTGTITGIREFGVAGNKNFQNNQVYNFSTTAGGVGGATFNGIHCSTGTIDISSNQIYALNSTGSTGGTGGTIYGVQITGGTTSNVSKNKIYNLSSTSTNPVVAGILISGNTTNTLSNNLIGDLRATAANAANPLLGISITGSTTTNVYFNTVYLNGSSSGALFGSSAISASTTPTVTLRNNIFVNLSSVSGSGLAVAHRRSSTTLTTYGSASNNNFFYAGTPGASNLIFYDGTNSDQTLAAYKARVAPRDAASATEMVSSTPGVFFQSFNGADAGFLHMVTGLSTQVESGAAPISGITDDYDSDVRNVTTPDIGADEFAGVLVDIIGPTISYTPLTNTLCLATGPTLSATITDASGVNTSAGTKPRIWFRKTTNANALPGTNDNTTDGWKYAEASNASSPFSLTIDYSLIFGGVASGDSIRYFVVAQDNAGTPNLAINLGTFAAPPPTVALNAGAFPVTGTNSYKILPSIATSVTIGAAGTYTSITGASGLFAAINAAGLSGNTTVTILDASVTESGANALNAIAYGCGGPFTLTIKPGAGVNAVLTGTVGAGAIIKLNGADNVTIDGSNNGSNSRNLTIQNLTTTTSGNAVVWLASPATGNGSTNNIIKNCIIEGNASTTTFLGMYIGGNTTISLTAAGTELNNNNTINNNLFRKSQYGLALFGFAAASPDMGNVISDNLFGTSVSGEGFNIEALHADRQQNLVVSGNDVQNVRGTSATNMYGIRLLDFKTGQAYNNKVHNLAYTGTSTTKIYGLAVQSSSYTTAGNPSQSQIYNNAVYDITCSGTSSVWNLTGILAGQGYSDKYYYNSIHLSGQVNNSTAGLSAAFANGDDNITTFGTNLDVRNNIFNLTGTSAGGNVWAYYSRATTLAGTTQSNNVIRCAGTGATNNTARLNSISYTTLAAWQTASGVDAGSLESDPLFNSNTNLQPQVGSPVLGAGVTIGGITTDILGMTRSGSTPTIGAYEQGVDVTAPAISYTALTNTLCLMGPSVSATISDASGINTTAGTKPRIWFRKTTNANVLPGTNDNTTDGWKYAESTSAMSPFSLTIDYSLIFGGVAAGDSIRYFVVAQDLATTPNVGVNQAAFASTPSSVALGAGAFPVTGTNSYKILTAIGTSVTIGASGTYTTLTGTGGLFEAINNGGLSANTTATIVDASVTEPGTVALNTIAYACGGPYNLTIKPSATTTLTGSSSGAIIRINAADNVIIDGSFGSTTNTICPPSTASRDLTITNTNTSTTSAVVWLQSNGSDGATNNTIKNCIVIGNSNTTTLFGIGSGSSTINTTSLGTNSNNNSFVNNEVSKCQFGIYTQGASLANKNTGNVINQNVMTTTTPNHISKGAIWTGFENNLTVSGNMISGMTQASVDLFGIALGMTGLSATAFSGNEVTNATVTKNIIGTVTNTGAFSAAGITVASATSGTNLIANNMIYGVAANGTGGDYSAGLTLGGGTGSTTNVYCNTINMKEPITGSSGASQTSACIAVTNSTEPVLDIRDNILVNTQIGNAGATLRLACIALGYSTFGNLTSNNNDLYCSGAGPGSYHVGITGGVVSGISRSTLADWQTATGKDLASLNFLPAFVSATNMHIDPGNTINLPLDGGGVSIAVVTDDIDCDTRTTDIGSDEFTPPACTIAMGGTATVTGASTFCGSGTPTITASGYSNGVGSGYQWMSSTSSGDYPMNGTPVSGQTNPATLSTGVVSVTTYYWLRVTCSTGMSTDYSNMLTITINPLPTATLSPSGTVNICPPVTSQLLTSGTNAMTPSYVWKKDGVTIGGETNSTYTVTVTGAYAVVITDGATSCSNTSSPTSVVFNPQPTAPIITPNSATMCFGDPAVLLTASGSNGTGSVTQSSGALSLAIPDFSSTGVSSMLSVAGVPAGATIDSVVVTVNISHTWDSDVEFNLEAPNGQIINLAADQGGSSDHYTNTRISSDGSKPALSSGSAPFTGTFKADATAQANLIGSPAITTQTFSSLFSTPNGSWTLRAYDDASAIAGTLTSWSIKVNYTFSATYTWSPSGMGSGLYNDAGATSVYTGSASPTVFAKPTSTTTYTATATNSGGCTNSSMVTITVNPAPSITPGSNPVECLGASTTNFTYSGASGSPDQYSIDFSLSAENQGFVDVVNAPLPVSPIVITIPGAAPVGVYTATLSVKNSVTGCVGAGMPISVTIESAPNAGTVTGTSPLCIGATTTYSTTGSGGTWSSSNPAVASVNTLTGLVTALTAGSTNIAYDVPANNCGAAASSFQALTVSPNVNPGTVSGNSPLCIGVMDTYVSNGDVGGTWSSTNTMVATVDAMTGVVTTIGAGTTDIKYTIGTGCGSPAFSMLTLTVNPNVNPGTVSGNTSLCVGSMDTYTSNGDPGGTWISTNTMIATVDAMTGVVTAVAAGTTDIRYTFSAGCGSPVFSFLTLTVAPTTVLNTNDTGAGSLRDIVSCAGDGATITFDASLTGQTILLTSGELIINKNLTFTGLGATNLAISGNGASRVFHLQAGKTLTITNMKLKDSSSMIDGGAALVDGYLILQDVIFENNLENGVPKSLTVTPAAIVEILGNVDLKN